MSTKKVKESKRKEEPGICPSPEDIAAYRIECGMSTAEAAALIYRTVRNWQQWESAERKMDPALWELFRIKVKGR
jgi:DNA-binding transcriptional regulator YiaG